VIINISPFFLNFQSNIIRMNSRILLLITSFIYSLTPLYSISELEFERLNSKHGLSTEEVRSIFQDSEGYIWLLTKEGLNRYDGYSFEIFKQGKSGIDFPTSSFESICEDDQGRLWLGTLDKGIIVFNKKNRSVIGFEELSGRLSLADNHIRSLLCDRNGNIWIGTEYGLHTYDPKSGELIYHNLGNPGSETPAWCIIEDLIEDSHGNIWIATWSQGLQMFSLKNNIFKVFWDFDAIPSTQHISQIKTLFQDHLGFLWVGTWEDGLYMAEIEGDELKIRQTFLFDNDKQQSISGNIIYSINQDFNNNLWVGTPYGLTIIESLYSEKPHFNRIVYNYGSENGLCNNEIWKIYRDSSGLMWLGTLEGGANKVHPGGRVFDNFSIPPVSSQIQSQTTQAFCIDPLGNFLVGVKSLGFGKYNLEEQKYIPYSQFQPYSELPFEINTVKCFLSRADELWLGTRYLGLFIVNTKNKQFTSLNEADSSFNPFEINTITQDKDGSVWVGTEEGLFRVNRNLDSKTYRVKKIEDLAGKRVKSVFQDQNTNIWVGTDESGIAVLSNEQGNPWAINHYNQKSQNTISNHIQCILQDSRGNLWAGSTDFGLLRYNPKTDSFEKAQVLINSNTDAIMAMVEDSEGSLWITSNAGIVRIYYQGGLQKSDNYTIADGLQGNIFLPGSIYQLNGNRIFAGGYYGFNAFYPGSVRQNRHIPPTVITSFLVNNVALAPEDYMEVPLIMKHNQNNLEIYFSALSYYKSEKNVFAYKLEDVNSDWVYIDASQRSLNFSNLGAGSYRFILRSANSSEVWNEQAQIIEFTILPAPYLTWWAVTGYTILFILLLVGLFRFLLKNERIKRAYELEKIEHARAEKLNQFKLRFFTNISHEILTPLSIMYCSIDLLKTKTRKGKPELQILERNINQLKRLLSQLLDFRKMESGHLKLKVQRENLSNFIEAILENFEPLVYHRHVEIKLQQHGTLQMGYFDEDKLNKAMHNLLSNAIKYTPHGGIIKVDIYTEKREGLAWAKIRVADTGVGIPAAELKHVFERFYRAEIGKEETGTGIGLSLTKNLIELHHGSITVDSEVGKGTAFMIEIPIHQSAFSTEELVPASVNRVIVPEAEGMAEKEPLDFPYKIPGRPKLLLAEDNPDFRQILKTYLAKKYEIIEASGGIQALKRAIRYKPDLIVSDVMMPGKNGYELCSELKNNIETKLIPVILLTAKTGDSDKTEGYHSGADSYITKPVSLPVLESRISSLLMKSIDREPVSEEPIKVQRSHGIQRKLSNEQFIRLLKKVVEHHISDSEFQVSDMHIQFGMSSSMFYRRVKELTKLAPVEYVKHYRLNRAASMLKKDNFSIAEIAYATGFSDQSYFGVCFRKQFGMTPSAFAGMQV